MADSEDYYALSGSTDKTLKLWDLDRAVCMATLEGHGDSVLCVSADFASQRALSGSGDCKLCRAATVQRRKVTRFKSGRCIDSAREIFG